MESTEQIKIEAEIDELPKENLKEETPLIEDQEKQIDEKITETVDKQIEDTIQEPKLETEELVSSSSNEPQNSQNNESSEQQLSTDLKPVEEMLPAQAVIATNQEEPNTENQSEETEIITESATAVVETIISNIVNETSNQAEQSINEAESKSLYTVKPLVEIIRMDESRDSHAETIESFNEDTDNENSAVNAVLAAVEQASAERATTSADAAHKIVKKKQKNAATPSKNANNYSANENLNSSPLSSQKRRKKDPLAPKAPLNGYLVYFNEERADMRQKNPQMSFGELTKIIALKWKDLPAEEKQKYINEAELDKERYVKEMADYKKSDSYKQYLKETSNAKMARNEESHHNHHSQQHVKNEKVEPNFLNNSLQSNQPTSINSLQHEVNVAGFDIPIFTEEFIEHSKNREHEMRQIRKEINELEQQNNVLYKHIENMKQSTDKVESDIEKYQAANDKIAKNIDIFRQTILNCFSNLPLPNTQEYPSPANIDDYIMKLYSILANTPQNDSFKMHVKSTLTKINFSSLFDSI